MELETFEKATFIYHQIKQCENAALFLESIMCDDRIMHGKYLPEDVTEKFMELIAESLNSKLEDLKRQFKEL